MTSSPENLQVIKIEPPSPEKCTNHIKERLNLHVKRRLQQDTLQPNAPQTNTSIPSLSAAGLNTTTVELTKRKSQKESPKTRRPYQKRADKVKTEPVAVAITKGKKSHGSSVNTHTASPAELDALDDSYEQEMDGKSCLSREKEKCPDILGMVLSTKKQALMQDPEVQAFLTKIYDVLKS